MEMKCLKTDILIIGGGTAGCYGALTIAEQSNKDVIIAEKAHIKRSGCLAAGVNAINAYIVNGQKPEDYVQYAKKDAAGIVREDLLHTMSRNLNQVTKKMEELGLVILKDENGNYVNRGNRNIKINGENIKPLLADAVLKHEQVQVLNHVNITDLIVEDNKVYGAYGYGVNDEIIYVIYADAVICSTGGAAGLYRPNNPGFSRHKMWYPPFNTGAGYAMGIKAGAEMTTLEMRFIALRCKDTIAPTGTIAQGAGAPQVNSFGENYESKYGITTPERVYGTVSENKEGRGPCYLKTEGISGEQDEELLKAYLNMAPAQTLKWIEAGKKPSAQNVEIEGTEPYVVGGHTASGYWVDTNRMSTVSGLFAAGDVAGGCPQKYVTGALVEGEIAAQSALDYIKTQSNVLPAGKEEQYQTQAQEQYLKHRDHTKASRYFTVDELEEAMQKVMDSYAGGISSHYQYNQNQLCLASEKITHIMELSEDVIVDNSFEFMRLCEVKERLIVCQSLIAHLAARKETRWHSFAENMDYPDQKDEWLRYVNSKMEDGRLRILFRDIVKGDCIYEHTDQ